MRLSQIHAALKEIRVSPVKTLGQNFLHDQNLARWIVDQAQITAEDYVVEIGPGLGALTRFLLEKERMFWRSKRMRDLQSFCVRTSEMSDLKSSTQMRSSSIHAFFSRIAA